MNIYDSKVSRNQDLPVLGSFGKCFYYNKLKSWHKYGWICQNKVRSWIHIFLSFCNKHESVSKSHSQCSVKWRLKFLRLLRSSNDILTPTRTKSLSIKLFTYIHLVKNKGGWSALKNVGTDFQDYLHSFEAFIDLKWWMKSLIPFHLTYEGFGFGPKLAVFKITCWLVTMLKIDLNLQKNAPLILSKFVAKGLTSIWELWKKNQDMTTSNWFINHFLLFPIQG